MAELPQTFEMTPAAVASVFLMGSLATVGVGIVVWTFMNIRKAPMDAYPSELEDDSIT